MHNLFPSAIASSQRDLFLREISLRKQSTATPLPNSTAGPSVAPEKNKPVIPPVSTVVKGICFAQDRIFSIDLFQFEHVNRKTPIMERVIRRIILLPLHERCTNIY